MAQETQYCSFKYIFGTAYSAKTEASEISPEHDNVSVQLAIPSVNTPIYVVLLFLRGMISTYG